MLPALLGMLGQAALPGLVNYGIGKFDNYMNGGQGQNADQQMLQNYQQQIQQPINMGMGNRQQQLINDFQQNLIPGMQEQFAGAGGMRSSAFGQQMGSALGNLNTNLGALGEQNQFQNNQLNQNRLGEMRGYLGQQQGFGMQQRELNQRGGIANMEHMLRGMGLMQNYDLGQQQNNTNRLDILGRFANGLGQQGMQGRFDTMHHAGRNPTILDILRGIGQQ